MSELRELYQTVILDHNKKPRNFGALDGASVAARSHESAKLGCLEGRVEIEVGPQAVERDQQQMAFPRILGRDPSAEAGPDHHRRRGGEASTARRSACPH